MAPLRKGKPSRLEDFILLAKEGKRLQVTLELRREDMQKQVHPSQTENGSGIVHAYLLLGEFSFKLEGEYWKVPKVYAMGTDGEPQEIGNLIKDIANERLKMDYQRLRESNIGFNEIYF